MFGGIKTIQKRKFWNALRVRSKFYLRVLSHTFDIRQFDIKLHIPGLVEPDLADQALVDRIFNSFRKMKSDQKKVSSCYLPSSMWQRVLDKAYSNLENGVHENNLYEFHKFLSNFGVWKSYTGIYADPLILKIAKSFVGKNFLRKAVFYKQILYWKWFYNGKKQLNSLSCPSFGNLFGAYLNDCFLAVGCVLNDIYSSILAGLIENIKRPVVSELGAGHGRLAYYVLRNIKDFVYIDFDLPETLCTPAYYLMKAFPDKRALLYGEEEYSLDAHRKYDLIFMPSYEMSKLEKQTVDLFINKNSLGEMTSESVSTYINHIIYATRGYFSHMNHDVIRNIFQHEERGLLSSEYPIPKDEFILLSRFPAYVYEGVIDKMLDNFIYLYSRIPGS